LVGGIGTQIRNARSPRRTQYPNFSHARNPATIVASGHCMAINN
jgi:hypothetical protein